MYELLQELPNHLTLKDLRKLGNFKKISEMLRFDGAYPAVHPKTKFWRFLIKIAKQSILLNFLNLSPTFCRCFGVLTESFFWIDLVIRLKSGRNAFSGPKLGPKTSKLPKSISHKLLVVESCLTSQNDCKT